MIRRLALTAILLLAALAPARAVERILRFVSDVTVEAGGDLLVTETIAVQAEGAEIRHGILRDFPTVYTRRDGARVQVGFDVTEITRDNETEPWTIESLTNGKRVRIGNGERLVSNGPHTYVIRYRTTRQIGFFADYDELYWNATGTGWTFGIDQAEARITLPQAVPFQQSALYTGPEGARGKDAVMVESRPGYISFRTIRPLPPHNGLTVAADWQKGVISPPTSAQRTGWLLDDNPALLVAAVALVLIGFYYVLAWYVVGRDPPTGTIIPLFGPPEGMSAATVRYVSRMGFDDRTFAAAIIELGVNGYVTLKDLGHNTLVNRQAGSKPLGPAERAMLPQQLLLVQANHSEVTSAMGALRGVLEENYKGKLFRNHYGWSVLGAFATVVAVAAIALASEPGTTVGMLVLLGMLWLGLGMLRGSFRLHFGPTYRRFAAVALGAIGLAIMFSAAPTPIAILPGMAGALLGLLAIWAFQWLKAPSVSGRKIMDQIDGLREYLGVAEEERLDYLNPPNKTPELFERFLPYAVALDVENRWANRFAAVLAAAAVGGAAASSWYSGSYNPASDPGSFADHIGTKLTDSVASASTAPGSSDSGGSSGGGSSGGGGGGGGGSGW